MMAITYRLAKEEDIENLVNFRWQYVYKTYAFDRKDMCSFRGGFRYFVRTGFKDGYRCLMALNDDQIVGTVYLRTISERRSYKDKTKGKDAYIKYLDVLSENEAIRSELLDRVMAMCRKEKVNEVYTFQHDQVIGDFVQRGFKPQMDYLKLKLAA